MDRILKYMIHEQTGKHSSTYTVLYHMMNWTEYTSFTLCSLSFCRSNPIPNAHMLKSETGRQIHRDKRIFSFLKTPVKYKAKLNTCGTKIHECLSEAEDHDAMF